MRTIAITSGKGGVGKTNLSANLGIALASYGKRVVVFDADLGLANLDVVLGTRAPFTLQNVLAGEKRLRDVLCPGPGGIRFIAGGSGIEALLHLSGPQLDRFLTELSELEREADILVFDTGAGIDDNVMTFLEAADETLLVSTPDPASITDAYATVKILFARKPDAVVRVVMNMVSDEAQAKAVFAKLQTISRQFLDRVLLYAGHVHLDHGAVQCIRRREPFAHTDANLRASRDVAAIAARLLGVGYQADREKLSERLRSVFGAVLRRSA